MYEYIFWIYARHLYGARGWSVIVAFTGNIKYFDNWQFYASSQSLKHQCRFYDIIFYQL